MESDPFKRLGWWWNRSWGTMTRRDVWLEYDDHAGIFQVRWRVGQYPDEDQWFMRHDVPRVIDKLKRLLGEDKSAWQETVYLDEHGTLWDYMNPTDAAKAIEGYLGHDDES